MNKRKHLRQPLDVEVNYATNAQARSKDISLGGICLTSEDPMDEGRFYTLVFLLPCGDKLECIGKTCWCRKVSGQKHESGIQFWKIGEKTQAKLEAYIDQQCA